MKIGTKLKVGTKLKIRTKLKIGTKLKNLMVSLFTFLSSVFILELYFTFSIFFIFLFFFTFYLFPCHHVLNKKKKSQFLHLTRFSVELRWLCKTAVFFLKQIEKLYFLPLQTIERSAKKPKSAIGRQEFWPFWHFAIRFTQC